MPGGGTVAVEPPPETPALTGPGGLPYRRGVGMMLLNPDKQVLVGRRVDMPSDAWQMPQGGIDRGEEPDLAMWRELREEIGTDRAECVARAARWLPYDLPHDLAPRLWGGRYAGQVQLWYLLRFTGTDSDIVLDRHHAEFDAVRWVPPASLPDLVIWFKRDIYRTLLQEFGPHLGPGD